MQVSKIQLIISIVVIFSVSVITLYFTFSHTLHKLSLCQSHTQNLSRKTRQSLNIIEIYHNKNNLLTWKPTGHYHGEDKLLVEKKVIIDNKHKLHPIIQTSVARFKKGGLVDFHSHPTAIETFTGIEGKCVFELFEFNSIKNNFSVRQEIIEIGDHIIIPAGIKHSVKNNEINECKLLATLIDVNIN